MKKRTRDYPGSTTKYRKRAPAKRRASIKKQALIPKAVARTGGILALANPVEKKFIDTTFNTDGTATATIGVCNGCAPGSTGITRIGRRIMMKSFQMRIFFRREDPATSSIQVVRFLVVYDRQTNGAAPVITDILDAGNVQSMHNMDNVLRFYTLYDKVFTLDGAGGTTSVFETKYIKLNLPVTYNSGTAGTVADIATGGIFLAYVGNTAAGVDDTDVNIQTRIRFTDS